MGTARRIAFFSWRYLNQYAQSPGDNRVPLAKGQLANFEYVWAPNYVSNRRRRVPIANLFILASIWFQKC